MNNSFIVFTESIVKVLKYSDSLNTFNLFDIIIISEFYIKFSNCLISTKILFKSYLQINYLIFYLKNLF